MWFINDANYDIAKHIATLGVVVLVGFSFIYFSTASGMESEIASLKVELDSSSQELESASLTNDQKVAILKANVRKAETLDDLGFSLLIYRIVAGVFAVGGLVMMKMGLWLMYQKKQS